MNSSNACRLNHLVALVAFLLVAHCETASAKCGPPQPIRSVSASKEFGLNVDFNRGGNPFSITRNGEIVASGLLDISGHHLAGLIDDTGAFLVLHDKYESLTIYNGTGQILARFTPQQLLSVRERRTRPAGWACHPEGKWSSAVSIGSDGRSVVVLTHTGRQIVIDLASAQVVKEDQDMVQWSIVAGVIVSLFAGGLTWRIWRHKKRSGR